MSVEKYRKKPVEIEAVQWDGTAAGATPVIDWILIVQSRVIARRPARVPLSGPGQRARAGSAWHAWGRRHLLGQQRLPDAPADDRQRGGDRP